MTTIYQVWYSHGEYSDYSTGVVASFENENDAGDLAKVLSN